MCQRFLTFHNKNNKTVNNNNEMKEGKIGKI